MTPGKSFHAFLLVIIVVASTFSQTELVKNGNFSNGSTGWSLGRYGGSSSGSVVNGEHTIIVTTSGTEHWHVQFTQTGLSLVQGKTYAFSFDAYKGNQNSGNQSMQINIGQSSSPYTSYFGIQNQIVTLTTTKTRYTYQITMAQKSDPNSRIEFNCGKSTGGFYIDNVSLIEQTSSLLSATPQSVDFGTVTVGNPVTSMITLHNNGTSATTVSSLTSSSSLFTTTLAAPVSVPASGSTTVPVTFTAGTPGLHTGTFTIHSNASDNPLIAVNLSGVSEYSGIQINPAALSFSTSPGLAASGSLVLTNTGSSAITWNIASDDSWISITPRFGTIPAGSSITCITTVTPFSLGNFTGSLTLTHSAANQPSPFNIQTTLSVVNGYQPTCPLIIQPDQAIDYILDLVAFRMRQRDNTYGGYYTNIDRQGNWTGVNEKALCGQSRIAYAFVRAFMVSGDERYLEYARHALKFLYAHGWNNGWYFATDIAGNYISHWGHNDWWSFQQHYALVGISAMVEATGGNINWNDGLETDHTWLMRGINSNYANLWDSNPSTKGYFDRANTSWTNKWNKGFHATVDGITTHALLMAMMFDSLDHKQRLIELTDNIVDHLIGNMPNAVAGFPEVFKSNWDIDYSNSNMDIGHGFKTAWVLQRVYMLNPDHPEYRDSGHVLMDNLWTHGCYDTIYGAPFSYLNWQTGAITGMNKDFWMVEQGFTSGIINYYTAQTQQRRDRYLRIADESLNFFLNHNIDPVYGEAYSVVSRDGSTIVDGNKGGLFTAGYHSVELGYYAYLYSSLYYHKRPVQLYYYYSPEASSRNIKLTPIAIENNVLKITSMTLDGTPYNDFDADSRTVHLPAGVGGKLKVTFGFTPPVYHSITATANNGGAIKPSGVVSVIEGTSRTFTFAPQTGYRIRNVIVDGVSAGTVNSYTFSGVSVNHTIAVEFEAIPSYTIAISSSSGGTASPSGIITVLEGTSKTVTFTPSAGYQIASVLVDGVSVGVVNSFTFSSISDSHSISASFSALSQTVYQINTGSTNPVNSFSADRFGTGGTLRTVTNTVDFSGVTNPAPQGVYQSERYGNSKYTIPNLSAGAQYTVRLHFAELYQTAAGRRIFNVAINGVSVLSNFDIYAITGVRYKALLSEFTATANSSGQIVIVFTTVTDNATISGIEILSR